MSNNTEKVSHTMRHTLTHVICLFLLLMVTQAKRKGCLKKEISANHIVCVCNSEYCDSIPEIHKPGQDEYIQFTSNREGLRFEKEIGVFETSSRRHRNEIEIRPSERYQRIEGFGGAFTDATGINIDSLSKGVGQKLLEAYFSKDGIEYNLGRVPIGGTDFSTRGYSYHDRKDKQLSHFKLADEDFDYKIPLIKEAKEMAEDELQLIASAWTAPKWMKSNNEYAGVGFLKSDMYQTWADYFVKFLEEYDNEDIEFWAITTGNEPSNGMVPLNKINSVGWTHWQMSDWIRKNLGPTIKKSKYSSVKIFALDDQIFLLPWYIDRLFDDKKTEEYIDGIAVHWYYNKYFPVSILKSVHDNYPDKMLLQTEACQGSGPFSQHVKLGSWYRGEDYANDIIQEMKNYVSGWLDWNMALDLTGGPTYIKNNVDSPILVNASANEFYKQPMYYAIGHFSKFVPRRSFRIYSSDVDDKIPVVAFRRPDRGIVVVILNTYDEDKSVTIVDEDKGTIPLDLTEKSITTIIYW